MGILIRMAIAITALGLTATGCYTSNYIPQSQGRVSTIMKDSQVAYVRDGRIIKHGTFGKGLIRAVAGNPAAERAARQHYQRQKNGFLMFISGLTCSLVAVAVGASRVGQRDNHNEVPATELTVAAGCLVFGYAGLFHAASAAPYRFDAINIFNDSTRPYLRGPPGYRGPTGRPYGKAGKNDQRPNPRTTALSTGE